ncbi:amino acid ABC transporter permease [Psychrobacillus sp. NEAU-3TGS]|uniref:amino acid ABC transporter permease n=1 Tax=Psychrobacillus sp. NEAU-3TGS TaxID=2995412 RepID=UPI002498D74C|nr:amino acid ABC transporter permease [Psychrobacillus sp. NEAU-3TGS]MDI2586238.1 amino acid ABC transporter permease [Psychrobacillus sp. NEAU-3TGS]
MQVVLENLPQILEGLKFTVYYSIVAIILAVIFGLIAALMKLSKSSVLSGFASVYIEVFRSTPLLVQLFFIVFGLTGLLPLNEWFGQRSYPIIAATITLALHEGAYISEIIRAGIQGVDRGQKEAAASIGMTEFLTMRYIVLPQAFKRMIPPLVNQSAQTIKDTSLLAPIGIIDLVYRGQIVIATTFEPFAIWLTIGLIYFILIFSVSQFAGYLERRLQLDNR